jgi:hypothetical protein
MKIQRVSGVALLVCLFAGAHFLLWVGMGYIVNYFSSELKVSPSVFGEYIAILFDSVHAFFSWPLSLLSAGGLGDAILVTLVALQCFGWGSVWFLMAIGLRGVNKRLAR